MGEDDAAKSSRSRTPSLLSVASMSYKPPQDSRANGKGLDKPEAVLSRQVSHGSAPIDAAAALSRIPTTQNASTGTELDPAFEVDFDESGDKGNPRDWPLWYKGLIIGFVSFSTTTVVMYSTAFASGIPGMMETFGISDETLVVMGITTYLFGLAVGSVVLAPLSEMYGRRPIYIISMAMFAVLVIPCGLADNLQTILITRFFGAFAGSAMISNSPGTVSDIVSDEYRALAFSIWSLGPMNGPAIGPIIGGFVFQSLGWRWTNWMVMIGAGVSFILISSFGETYAPAILRKRAQVKRKETGDERWFSRYDEKVSFWPLLKINLSRPFVMMVTEPILIFWDIYIALVYAILYLCFVAYPFVFSEQRGWPPGYTGLSYVGMATGGCIVLLGEPLIRKLINSQRPRPDLPVGVPLSESDVPEEIEGASNREIPTENNPPPEAMVLIVLIASISIPVGELLFSWTTPPWIHWIFPILAGIPFGAGNIGVFIYASNYLVHSYGIYAASALAGNAVLRSVVGGTLPLAGPAMYRAMGSRWAGTLLGGLEFLCVPIPYVFWKHGWKIRQKSKLIGEMREDQERLQKRKKNAAEAIESKNAITENQNQGTAEPKVVDIEKKIIEKETV